jgi:hypothetical protein
MAAAEARPRWPGTALAGRRERRLGPAWVRPRSSVGAGQAKQGEGAT